MRIWRTLSILAILIALSGLTAGCGAETSGATEHYGMAHLADMPAEVQEAPVRVREAYQFSVANPDIAKAIPCYCGCSALGHTSSYGCYVSGQDANGALTYDLHAVGCGVCVDITQDTMRGLRNGQSVAEIKADIDQKYARFGPSTGP